MHHNVKTLRHNRRRFSITSSIYLQNASILIVCIDDDEQLNSIVVCTTPHLSKLKQIITYWSVCHYAIVDIREH